MELTSEGLYINNDKIVSCNRTKKFMYKIPIRKKDIEKIIDTLSLKKLDLKIKSYIDITSSLTVAKILVGNLSKIEN